MTLPCRNLHGGITLTFTALHHPMQHFLRTWVLLLLIPVARISAQQVTPWSHMATELCDCLGSIDANTTDRDMDLALRLCLSTTLSRHSGEVVRLMHRYPAQDRQYYLLGLVLGGALDRTCPRYALIKERLHPKHTTAVRPIPST